eukprot:scaffold47792_cov69-Phaeocystis_antarctica.AAC.2
MPPEELKALRSRADLADGDSAPSSESCSDPASMCDECVRCHRKSSGRTRPPEFSLAFSTHRACLSADVAKEAEAAAEAAIDAVEAAGPEVGMAAAGQSGGEGYCKAT